MGFIEFFAILLAGLWAGLINTVVGSGTLVTFPVLLAFGHPPLVANISNSLGLVAGGVSGAWGYRHEFLHLRRLLMKLVPFSLVGGMVGAGLLLVLPSEVFDAVVPWLVLFSLILIIVGPKLNRMLRARQQAEDGPGSRIALVLGIFAAGVYGGYFGAAQGVILVGIMSILLPAGIQAINGLKNALGVVVNACAALVFVIASPDLVNWWAVLAVALGSIVGGLIGARVGRRLSATVLRAVIVVVGSVALALLVA